MHPLLLDAETLYVEVSGKRFLEELYVPTFLTNYLSNLGLLHGDDNLGLLHFPGDIDFLHLESVIKIFNHAQKIS